MKLKFIIITYILIGGYSQKSFCQTSTFRKEINFQDKIQELILNENKAGQKYFFKVESNEIIEYEITYLGQIKNVKNNILKFLFVTSFSGLYQSSRRASSSIILYIENKERGEYYTGGVYDTIPRISGNYLVFFNNNGDCNLSTSIDFANKIPEEIFIKCNEINGKYFGDLYNLSHK